MGLGYKIALFLFLAILLLVLNIIARRRNFDRFRDIHTRRKYRVPVEPGPGEDPPGM